jgi:transcription elongation factor Elf1
MRDITILALMDRKLDLLLKKIEESPVIILPCPHCGCTKRSFNIELAAGCATTIHCQGCDEYFEVEVRGGVKDER